MYYTFVSQESSHEINENLHLMKISHFMVLQHHGEIMINFTEMLLL